MFDPCAATVAISALAAVLAKGKSQSEIDELAVFFTQLGNNLSTISSFMDSDPTPPISEIDGQNTP